MAGRTPKTRITMTFFIESSRHFLFSIFSFLTSRKAQTGVAVDFMRSPLAGWHLISWLRVDGVSTVSSLSLWGLWQRILRKRWRAKDGVIMAAFAYSNHFDHIDDLGLASHFVTAVSPLIPLLARSRFHCFVELTLRFTSACLHRWLWSHSCTFFYSPTTHHYHTSTFFIIANTRTSLVIVHHRFLITRCCLPE